MTPLQELTKKIQAHCPELVELSFGCKIGVYKEPPCKVLRADDDGEIHLQTYNGAEWSYKGDLVQDGYEILGHPITLEHVLKAIAIQNSGELFDIQAFDGELIRITLPNWDTDSNWTLGSPLHLQSEPLINWLNTIIK